MTAPNPAAIYDSFFVPAMFQPSAEHVIELAKPGADERALDIACGTGVVARMLAKSVRETVGLDISAPMIAVASERAPGIEFRVGSAVELPFPDASFDLVTCQHGIQFFPDRLVAASEMKRVLRPGGRAVVAAWSDLSRHRLVSELLGSIAKHLRLPLEAISKPFSVDDTLLRSLLSSAGFAQIEIVERKIVADYASADKYVRLTLIAAAAVLPQLASDDLDAIVEGVQREVGPTLAEFRVGDRIVMDQFMSVAIAS